MPDYETLRDVSVTLQTLLTDALGSLNITGPPEAMISDLQGDSTKLPLGIALFLYEMVEDANTRNRPKQRTSTPPNITIAKPPLALCIRYMITPWSGDATTDQLLLGRVMQVLHDNPIIGGTQLQGSLAGTSVALKTQLVPLTLEERTRVWHAIQKPYRLSVIYEVRVVKIDPVSSRKAVPVSSSSLDYNQPEAGP